MCHAHHITHWADGGATSLDNLILLCGHHHRLIHTGPWHLHTTSTGDFEFTPPDTSRREQTGREPPDP